MDLFCGIAQKYPLTLRELRVGGGALLKPVTQ